MFLTNFATRALRQGALHITNRGVATMGKHFAQLRREEAAKKAVARAEHLTNAAKKKEAIVAEVSEIVDVVKKAEFRTKLVNACDSKSPVKVAAGMKTAVETEGVEFSPREITQMLLLGVQAGELTYKSALQLFQKVLEMDLVPERSAFRALLRTLEKGKQWKAANVIYAFLKDVYPLQSFGEDGTPIVHPVLQNPIPNMYSLAQIPTEENTFEEFSKFLATRQSHGRAARFETLHHYVDLCLQRGDLDTASKELFAIFNRLGARVDATVPKPFDPIEFHHCFPETVDTFEIPLNLYYRMSEALEAKGNFSAAMQILIYLRSFNRHLDVTPYRELTAHGKERDFIDLHMVDKKTCYFIIKHWMKELRIRRGYVAAFNAQSTGIAEAKTYVKHTVSNAHYSPLISTEPFNLVILTDRSYNNKDIREEKGDDNTLATEITRIFKSYNIETVVASVSELSSSESAVQDLQDGKSADVARELTVIVPAAEFLKYGDAAAAAIKSK